MKKSFSIVSLVPSITELLFTLDLDKHVAGRTRFCIHPEQEVKHVPIIGGTKNPRLDKIKEIKPDIIIANKEENRIEDVDELASLAEILLTDIGSIEDALISIYDIAQRFQVEDKAKQLISNIRTELDLIPNEHTQRVAYFIWREPWMTIGGDTYIHSVLKYWNLENVYGNKTRYPKTSINELKRKNPELILLSSEPYPFKEKHQEEIETALPDARVLLVDGEWFSWYGSRMLPSFKKLNSFRKAIS